MNKYIQIIKLLTEKLCAKTLIFENLQNLPLSWSYCDKATELQPCNSIYTPHCQTFAAVAKCNSAPYAQMQNLSTVIQSGLKLTQMILKVLICY